MKPADIFKIKGRVQNYAWGGKNFIADLLDIHHRDQPIAEYWMGAHTKAPAIVESTSQALDELIASSPQEMLGKAVANKFGELPYLFKVLDVEDVLSIQVHPTKSEAETGFEKENKLGIPLSAANRNYKDKNHKPEVMVALSEFWLLHGFEEHSL